MRFLKVSGVFVLVVGLAYAANDAPPPTPPADRAVANQPLTLAGLFGERIYLPPGNAVAGRHAFASLRCNACHVVEGAEFAPPVAQPPVPVVIGPAQARLTRAAIAESIIAPSHRVAADLPNVRSGTLSRMGDFSDAMTVRELLDLVAFIESLEAES